MKFQDRYDIAIIGGGIGGLMTAYRLAERDPGLSICLMERGRDIRDRALYIPPLYKRTGTHRDPLLIPIVYGENVNIFAGKL